MRLKQKFAAALAVGLILLHGFSALAMTVEPLELTSYLWNPASPSDADTTEPPKLQTPSDAQPPEVIKTNAKEQTEVPVFSAELVEGGENPGLYGTLSCIPEDTVSINVFYSFNGEHFYAVEDSDQGGGREWDLSGLSGDGGELELTQLCIGADDHPWKAYEGERVNNLYIRLDLRGDGGTIQTEPVKLSHGNLWPVPDEPPEFSANIEMTFEGYVLRGTFTDFLPGTSHVRTLYSLDGETYELISKEGEPLDWNLNLLGAEDPSDLSLLQNQICAYSSYEPMKSYLKHDLERFYVKLQITTDIGETYETQSAVIERGIPKPPPDNSTVGAVFPASMVAVDKNQRPPKPYGRYQITVREGASQEEVYALLPDTLPIEVRILKKNTNQMITSGMADCDVTWKEIPDLVLRAGESIVWRDAANELVIPAGTEVSTPLGIYVLPEAVAMETAYESDEIRIVVNVIGKREKPDISLIENWNGNLVDDSAPLSLAFRLKPSGAVSVKAYAYQDGDEEWTEICDLLSRRAVDANQSAELYGYVDVLRSDESPYLEYRAGELDGFLIGIVIEGGTFDGERVTLPWPGVYVPPAQIPELDGSGGNENNVGSGDGSGDSNSGGQRPGLPDVEDPAVTPPSPGSFDPPSHFSLAVPEEEIDNQTPQPVNQPPAGESDMSIHQDDGGGKEPETGVSAELSTWSQMKPQDQPQASSIVNTTADADRGGGRLLAAVLLLGGGITAAAAAGGTAERLRAIVKKIFRRR